VREDQKAESGRAMDFTLTPRRNARTLARQAIGLVIFFSGFVVVVVYVLRRLYT
jgi:hypothetical protein